MDLYEAKLRCTQVSGLSSTIKLTLASRGEGDEEVCTNEGRISVCEGRIVCWTLHLSVWVSTQAEKSPDRQRSQYWVRVLDAMEHGSSSPRLKGTS